MQYDTSLSQPLKCHNTDSAHFHLNQHWIVCFWLLIILNPTNHFNHPYTENNIFVLYFSFNDFIAHYWFLAFYTSKETVTLLDL